VGFGRGSQSGRSRLCRSGARLSYVTVDDPGNRPDSAGGVAEALTRLATYGTLAPGRPNHHQLDGLEGRWLKGHVDGVLIDAGWGASLGYPALVFDPAGSAIAVDVFESVDLPAHWARLDAFEGPGYERVVTTVHLPGGDAEAYIYIASSPVDR
jgi:gamma-glutamylcyclotransferase (GGCT)/AIG2-like uncharacterized protein YtfP